jgi:formylglycine-generating enzyme required for sulfatase activity
MAAGCACVHAAAPRISGISVNSNALRPTLQSDVSITNQIQWSSDFRQANCTALTNLLVSQSPYQFLDPAPASPGTPRFYRVVALYPGVKAPESGFAPIPAGPFVMGNCMDPSEGGADDFPLHTVTVSAFYMETNLVTTPTL